EPAQDESEGSQSQICFGLAAASGEEEQIDHFTVGMTGLDDAAQVHEQERELKWPPVRGVNCFRLLFLQEPKTPASGRGHDPVCYSKCIQDLGILQQSDPGFNPISSNPAPAQQLQARFLVPNRTRWDLALLFVDPGTIIIDQAAEL